MRRGAALPSIVFAVLMLLALATVFMIEREPAKEENLQGLAGLSGGAMMSATPNPCVVPEGESACAVTITWMTDGSLPARNVQVWRVDEDPRMVACTPVGETGTLARTLAPGERKGFQLLMAPDCTDATALRERPLASVTVAAEGGSNDDLLRRTVARSQDGN